MTEHSAHAKHGHVERHSNEHKNEHKNEAPHHKKLEQECHEKWNHEAKEAKHRLRPKRTDSLHGLPELKLEHNPKNIDDNSKERLHLNGHLKSADGKKSLSVKDGDIRDEHGKSLGHFEGSGKIVSHDGRKTDANSTYKGWHFDGTEEGHKRSFQCSNDMSNGKLFLLDAKGKPVAHEVRLGMVLNSKTGEQLGMLKPPTEAADGKLHGGSLTLSHTKQELPLGQIEGAVFDVKLLGQSIIGRRLQGAVIGTDSAEPQFVNLQVARNTQLDIKENSERLADENSGMNMSLNFFAGTQSLVGETSLGELKVAEANLLRLDKVLNGGSTLGDLRSLTGMTYRTENDVAAGTNELNSANASSKSVEMERVHVPTLTDDAAVKQVNGRLRVGDDVYTISGGKLFQEDGRVDSAQAPSCGELLPGYRVAINGQQPVELAKQERVLIEFTSGADEKVHRVLGLGESRNTESFGFQQGGLVDVRDLMDKANKFNERCLDGQDQYEKNTPYLTGGLTDKAIGDRDELLAKTGEFARQDTQVLKGNLDELFDKGFDSSIVRNDSLDGSIRLTQLTMHAIGACAADVETLSSEGQVIQKQTADSVTIAVTSAATLGTGALVAGLAGSAKVAVAAEIAAGTAAGAMSSTAFRATESNNKVELALQGGLEGAAVAIGGAGNKAWARILTRTDAEPIALSALEGKIAALSTKPAGHAIKAAYQVGESATQVSMFNMAHSVGEGQSPMKGLNVGEVGVGTLGMLTGKFAGRMSSSLLTRGAANEAVTDANFLSTKVNPNGLAASLNSDVSNGFVFGGTTAIPGAMERQRQEVSRRLGISADQVTNDMFGPKEWETAFNDVLQGATTAAATNGLMTMGAFSARYVMDAASMSAKNTESVRALRADLAEVKVLNEKGDVVNVYDKIMSQPDDVLRFDQKTRIVKLLAHAREFFYDRDAVSDNNGYQIVNWKHTRGEVDQVLESCKKSSQPMTADQIEDAIVCSIITDIDKTPQNFIAHHQAGASHVRELTEHKEGMLDKMMRILNPRDNSGRTTDDRVMEREMIVLAHHIGPPKFMRMMAEMSIRNKIKASISEAADRVLGTEKLPQDEATISSVCEKLAKPADHAVNGKIQLSTQEESLLDKLEIPRWKIEDCPEISNIGEKIAKPFDNVSQQDQSILDFSDTQRKFLDVAGLKNWYVPDKNASWYQAARAVINGDSLINYCCPDGWAKIVLIRGPLTFFKDATIWDSVKSAKTSYDDAYEAITDDVKPMAEQGLKRTEAAVDRIKPEMQQWIDANKTEYGYQQNEKVEFWDAPLNYPAGEPTAQQGQRLNFAKLLRNQMADLLRREQGNYKADS